MIEKVVESFMEFLIGQVPGAVNLYKDRQKLKEKLELLNSKEADVHAKLQVDEIVPGRKRKAEVEIWLKNVDDKRRRIEELDQQVKETFCFDMLRRWRLAQPLNKMLGDIEELILRGSFSEELMIGTASDNVPLVTSEVEGVAFEQNLKNILSYTMDHDEVFSVGIYGMGGVGKTTLALHIHNKLLKESMYSGHVYWVTVSQEFDSHKLQNGIAQRLNLDLSGEIDERRRAALLHRTLMEKEKFVLILDDVWKPFSLEKIGVPIRTNGCKLLITSRSVKVCNEIGCEKKIKVETLSESEAWKLFQGKLLTGDRQSLEPEVEKIAKEVARRCGGLPLGIVTMAGTMRGVNDIHEWKDVLGEMRSSYSLSFENMGNDVFPILLCSYSRLGDPKLQRCFLYCCLYPEDFIIPRDELINMFIMEDLMDRRTSREANYDQGHSILNKLVSVGLLEEVVEYDDDLQGVKMHDLVREMGLRIKRDEYMVKAGLQLRQIPPWTENHSKVSLMMNKICDIPSVPDACPNLSTLLLNENELLLSIPDSFFLHMPNLHILDLSYTGITKLPDSIMLLENLKALRLSRCWNLEYLPSLENLKALRELDLSECYKIEEEIVGIEKLTNLESLNLFGVDPDVIPIRILCKLPRLQKLLLYRESVSLEDEVTGGFMHLEEFVGTFRNMYDLKRFMNLEYPLSNRKLHTYHIYVGCQFLSEDPVRYNEKCLSVVNCSLKEIGSQNEIMLPQCIKSLWIESCKEIECIVRLFSEDIQNTLGRIETLNLLDLPEFDSVIKLELPLSSTATYSLLPTPTFSCLKTLQFSSCKRMKVAIPTQYLLTSFQNLEHLWVSDCEEIEEIFGGEYPNQHYHRNGVGNNAIYQHTVILPMLRILHLTNLPQLKSICNQTMICDSLHIIDILKCPKLKKIPILLDTQSRSNVLKCGEREHDWLKSLEWADA